MKVCGGCSLFQMLPKIFACCSEVLSSRLARALAVRAAGNDCGIAFCHRPTVPNCSGMMMVVVVLQGLWKSLDDMFRTLFF